MAANNLPVLRFPTGFDVGPHRDYVGYLQQHRALPTARDGLEMHQPPLYYLVAATALRAGGLGAGDPAALRVLQVFGLLTGVAQVALVAACLRLVFPADPFLRFVGVLLAAFVPVHLYTAHYPSNDLLAGALGTASVYLCLTVLRAERASAARLAALGACLGAAVLTKLSALSLVPAVLAVLAGRLVARRSWGPGAWAREVGLPAAACAAVCGWFFARNWVTFGTPLIGSYDPASGFSWWQEPGYSTRAYLAHFGRSLTDPYFSEFYGLPDGLYSTLWGDGLWGGAARRVYRPPWNYDLMAAGYLLALLPAAAAVIGAAAALVDLVRRPRAEGFLLLGVPFLAGAALLYHFVSHPYYCHVKAFYGLAAAAPLCALAARGVDLLAGGRPAGRAVLAVALGTWALTAYASFWVDGRSPQAEAWAGQRLAAESRHDEALGCYNRALRADPSNGDALMGQGLSLSALRRHAEAAETFRRLIALDPDDPRARLGLGLELVRAGRYAEAARHLEHAARVAPDEVRAYRALAEARRQQGEKAADADALRQALRITPDDVRVHEMLGDVLASQGEAADAVCQYRAALRRAPDRPTTLGRLARILATHPDPHIRNGAEALELAERGCRASPVEDPLLLDTLAGALAESGRFRDAEAVLRRALRRASGNDAAEKAMRRELALYESGRPLREDPAAR
jgi:tetratricopeptide (TPR) repeat protein